MSESSALLAFQAKCHEYYTCFALASSGMVHAVSSIQLDPVTYPNQKLFIGHSHPDEGPAQSVMPAEKAVRATQRDGEFQDVIGKALITLLYAEWDEYYRHQMASEFGVSAKDVASDLMGDLRLVRHWVVHCKSVVQSNVKKIKVLPWALHAGDRMHITSGMFRQLADCFNSMQVQILNVPGAGDDAT